MQVKFIINKIKYKPTTRIAKVAQSGLPGYRESGLRATLMSNVRINRIIRVAFIMCFVRTWTGRDNCGRIQLDDGLHCVKITLSLFTSLFFLGFRDSCKYFGRDLFKSILKKTQIKILDRKNHI